ncbi:hypothetical protein D3C85_1321630 [compost metagenome]
MLNQNISNNTLPDQLLRMTVMIIPKCAFNRMGEGQVSDIMKQRRDAQKRFFRAKVSHE